VIAGDLQVRGEEEEKEETEVEEPVDSLSPQDDSEKSNTEDKTGGN